MKTISIGSQTENLRKKTLLIGSFGAENIGDELILLTAQNKYPQSIVMTANPEKSQEFLEKEFETIPPFPTGIRTFLNYIQNTNRTKYILLNKKIDQIVFPGGGLFSKSLKAIWIWTLHIWWSKQLFPGKKIHLESQGVDMPSNILGKFLLSWSLKNIQTITVRDTQSQKNIEKISGKKVEIVGDTAENYIKKSPSKKEHPIDPKIPGKNILLNAAKAFNYELLNKKIEQKNIDFIAFDKEDLNKTPKNFTGKKFFPKTISELWDIFEKHDQFIGQRFHFLILAHHFAPKNTFLLETPYAPKTLEYQKQNSLKQI